MPARIVHTLSKYINIVTRKSKLFKIREVLIRKMNTLALIDTFSKFISKAIRRR